MFASSGRSQANTTEGVQNEHPQNVPLWHVNYFELKLIKAQKTQQELLFCPQLLKRI